MKSGSEEPPQLILPCGWVYAICITHPGVWSQMTPERFSGVSVAGLWSGGISRSGTGWTTQARYLGHDCSHKSVKHTVHTLRQKSLCRRMLVEWRGFTTGQYRWLSGADRSRYGADLPCLAMRTGPNVRRCFALKRSKRTICLHFPPFFSPSCDLEMVCYEIT